ncbi:MAG: hypothetical protein OXE43_06065 [Chloroflexi bacterium]|nr:hypothetical protein [Chloroflexota bacterium]
MADDATREAYREAWEAWTKQLERMHEVLLDGEPLTPDRLKGLLNREARAKQAYDEARLKLLGLDESAAPSPSGDENPFR